jgi:predicted nucleic acid-binding protein
MEKILSEKFFLDTNIIVYSFDSTSSQKQKVSSEIIESGLKTGKGCISYQVVQEFLNVACRKFSVPMKPEDAQIFLGMVLKPLCKVFSSISLYSRSLEISDRYRYSFYDSLIIASAQELSCKYLLSEDLKNGQEIEGLRIINPFL